MAAEDPLHVLDRAAQDDPNLPSIAYQARENAPIFIPWTRRSIALGAGLSTSIASNQQASENALKPSALAFGPGEVMYQLEPTESRSSFRQSSSSQAASSYEHMDARGSVSVGGSMLGASGRAEYSKTVGQNRDVCGSDSPIFYSPSSDHFVVEQTLSARVLANRPDPTTHIANHFPLRIVHLA